MANTTGTTIRQKLDRFWSVLFLTEEGYKKLLDNEQKGHIKILNHAKVSHGNLHYDRKEQVR